jgi:hypothetical protein
MIRCTRRRLLVGKPVVDGDHRRIETRQAFVCTRIDWLA